MSAPSGLSQLLLAERLGAALGAGLPASRALKLAAAGVATAREAAALLRAGAAANEGVPLGAALAQAELPSSFVALLEELAAEAQDTTFARGGAALAALAHVPIPARRLTERLFAALVYPTIVLLAVVLGSVFIRLEVLPPLNAWIGETGARVPWLAGRALQLLHVVLLPATAGLVLLAALLWRHGPLALRARLAPPLAEATLGSVCAALAATLEAGLTPGRALALTAAATADRVWCRALERARFAVGEGAELHEALLRGGILARGWAGTLTLGQQRGLLPETLAGIARAQALAAISSFDIYRALFTTALLLLAGVLVTASALAVLGGLS